MKTDLSEEEFWYLIRALANYKRHGTKINPIALRFWGRKYHQETQIDDSIAQKLSAVKNTLCSICGKVIAHVYSRTKYCRLCARYMIRMKEDKLPPETIKEVCDYIHENGYKCYYTGMMLEVNDSSSPWYCVLDHWKPHDQAKVVLTSAVFNDMKSDLSEEEFWYYIEALADYKQKNKPVPKRQPIYWYRLYPVEDV